MSVKRSSRLALILALTLVAGSCGLFGGDDTTTTTTAPTITTSTTVPETATTSSTTTTTLPSSPVLARAGDEGETVAAIQFLLVCSGYADITIDGEFGAGTTTGVVAAQTALGFPTTGEPTEDLFAVLTQGCFEDRPIGPGEEPITVVGYASTAPEAFSIPLLFGTNLTLAIEPAGVLVALKDGEGTALTPAEDGSFPITETGDYTIEVSTGSGSTMFSLEVAVAGLAEVGDWIITTDGIAYKDTEFPLGTAAGPMITKIFEFLGHNVRGSFDEFDTGWDDPGQEGFRGIFIEGLAFLFYGPTPSSPGIPETFGRVRYVGPSFDANENPRPAGWVQTLSGITVGNTLAELQETYGSNVSPGSDTVGHYYRFGAANGNEVCFYFGSAAPTATTRIVEISTECRG
ncbi:MAG: peptidoglycan-binding domain-containing protein, partial [Actinomycetota bacterium]